MVLSVKRKQRNKIHQEFQLHLRQAPQVQAILVQRKRTWDNVCEQHNLFSPCPCSFNVSASESAAVSTIHSEEGAGQQDLAEQTTLLRGAEISKQSRTYQTDLGNGDWRRWGVTKYLPHCKIIRIITEKDHFYARIPFTSFLWMSSKHLSKTNTVHWVKVSK